MGEGNADYGGMVQPTQKRVVPCVKGVECGFGTQGRRLGLLMGGGQREGRLCFES